MLVQADQCVGLSDGAVAFAQDPGFESVLARIKAENDRVLAESRQPGGRPHVGVAYVVPIPSEPGGLADALRHELQGAQLAQYRANRTAELGGTPAIRILIANVGDRGEQWTPAVSQIIAATNGPDHVVAVAGLGQSRETTRAQIRVLSSARIPMIATRLTADNLSTEAVQPGASAIDVPGLFRISPTNYEQVDAVVGYLEQGASPPLLIQDRNPTDPYAISLGDRFLEALTRPPAVAVLDPERFDSSLPGTENAFVSILQSVCVRESSVLYFAGRGVDVGPFVSAASARSCPDLPLTILTGDDGVDLAATLQGQLAENDDDGLAPALQRGISFRYTALAHPAAWAAYSSLFLPASTAVFQGDCSTCYAGLYPDQLDDGAAIMGYDSLLVVIRAVRSGVLQDSSTPVTPGAVQQQLYQIRCTSPVLGAGGPIAFDGSGRPVGKPVPVLELSADGTVTLVDLSITPGC